MKFSPDKTWPVSYLQTYGMADLLDRPEMVLDHGHFKAGVEGKKILITGAAGSIGGELARQLALLNPEKLVLVDCSESRLAEISEDLQRMSKLPSCVKSYPRNICIQSGMDDVMAREKPDWVFHAAAYKHVPFLEAHLVDAALTNITGTKIVADAAMRAGVRKFVFLSTDKAVYPSSVMGLTKRFCERMLSTFGSRETEFVVARLVNVLGSGGSVVPRFEKQLQNGFVEITDPDAARYFITPFEATQLLIESALVGVSGETLRFEMNTAQSIKQLALRLAACLGIAPEEVKINYTSLRSGEKLLEVLQYPDEVAICAHPSVVRRLRNSDAQEMLTGQTIAQVLKACNYPSAELLLMLLEAAVPEYRKVRE